MSKDTDRSAFLASLRVGVSGFLLKSLDPGLVRQAVKAVASGKGYIDPSLHRAVLDHLHDTGSKLNRLAKNPILANLTPRQMQIVMMIAQGKSGLQISKEIVVTHQSVRNHLTRVYRSLGVHSRTQLLALLETIVWPEPSKQKK